MDLIIVGLVIVAFAWVLTIHVAIAIGLARRQPRWRALVGLVVVPLGPYWAWREHMHKRAIVWGLAVVVYLIALVLALR
jgi:hypothetical protein